MMSLDVQVESADHRASSARTEATDFAIALTAGPNAWVTPDSASTPTVRAGLTIALTGYLAMASVTIGQIAQQGRGRSSVQQFTLGLATAAVMAILASSAVSAIRRQQHRGGRHSMLVWRVGSLTIFSAVWISTVPPGLAALIWPIGMSIGIEAAITARLIGHDRTLGTLYRNYSMSPLHLGAISAAVVSAIVAPSSSVDRLVICAICSLEVASLGAVAAYGTLRLLFQHEVQFIEAIQTTERTEEFRRRAHWIHDDVCADLREIRVKMAARSLDHDQVSQELDRLDDRLRERQLDEMLNGGFVAAAEILQSYVRRAQNAGVFITDVPRFEEASIMLGGETARLLRRCTAGFVANALSAGTTTMAFQIGVEGNDLVLAVTDDAGGFDLANAPAGRGLDSLVRELGADRMTSARSESGTTMMVRISLAVGRS